MRSFLLSVGMAIALSLPVAAQETPKLEVFGGYSYLRQNVAGMSFNLNGWNTSIAGNVTPWLGLVADFSGHYASPFGVRKSGFAALFGPRVSYRKQARATPFAHALFGAVHGISGVIAITPVPGGPGGIIAFSETAFGFALGGGVDVKVGQHLAVRAIQAEYLRTNFANTNQINARISAGVVFRFGGE